MSNINRSSQGALPFAVPWFPRIHRQSSSQRKFPYESIGQMAVLWPHPQQGPEAICTWNVKSPRRGLETSLGLLVLGHQYTVIPKPVVNYTIVKVRFGGYGDSMVHRFKVKAWVKIGVLRFCARWLHLLYLNILLGWILCLTGDCSPLAH